MSNGFTVQNGDARGAASMTTDRDPLAIAASIAATLATTAVARDERGGTPKEERDMLRQSGLLGLVVPTELGGWGAGWADTMRVVRILARAVAVSRVGRR